MIRISASYCTLTLLIAIFITACESPQHQDHGDANAHMNQKPFEELVANFESPERSAWQKPDQVLGFIGDWQGKRVMDIGCGTGYFSVRMARAGAQVIAADVDPRFLDYVKTRVDTADIGGGSIEIRKIPMDAPGLEKEEVDKVFLCDVYHHIQDRPKYFRQVAQGLKPEGQLIVLDFFKKEAPVGPPVKMKIAYELVQKELEEAGFRKFKIAENLLPYQYIVIAQR